MKHLEPPDSFYLRAAWSCLESRNTVAAQEELARISPDLLFHPDVLELRWAIQMQAGAWQLALELAQAIVNSAPDRPTGWIKRSFVLHKLKRTREALDNLFPAAERFDKVAVIPYNLACYAAELRYLWEAERWLKQAFEVGGSQLKVLALQNEDLKPLWGKLKSKT